jgi:hypothetical protein
MATGLSNKLTQQIGEFLACAELAKEGLIATPFAGNVPGFDVLVADEEHRAMAIQVKASRYPTWPGKDARIWMKLGFDPKTQRQSFIGPEKLPNPDLVYVCVAIAPTRDTRDRFFVLTASQLQKILIRGYTAWMEGIGWRRPKKPESYDIRWATGELEPYENNWALIKKRLAKGS